MNNKKIFITITIFVLLLIAGFSYWYFFIGSKIENDKFSTENKTSEIIRLTEQQKKEILSKTSNIPPIILSEKEKQEIINKTSTNTKPVVLTDEEIEKILNKTN